MLRHWQGHRRVTRRFIEAYPDDQLFTFSIGPMRFFGEMVMEIIGMGAPMVRGIVTGEWTEPFTREPRPKLEVLKLWDEATDQLNSLWLQIPPERFGEEITAFGQYTSRVHNLLLYAIDNEIHHRGQAWVYLRSMGIETPLFPDRH